MNIDTINTFNNWLYTIIAGFCILIFAVRLNVLYLIAGLLSLIFVEIRRISYKRRKTQ